MLLRRRVCFMFGYFAGLLRFLVVQGDAACCGVYCHCARLLRRASFAVPCAAMIEKNVEMNVDVHSTAGIRCVGSSGSRTIFFLHHVRVRDMIRDSGQLSPEGRPTTTLAIRATLPRIYDGSALFVFAARFHAGTPFDHGRPISQPHNASSGFGLQNQRQEVNFPDIIGFFELHGTRGCRGSSP